MVLLTESRPAFPVQTAAAEVLQPPWAAGGCALLPSLLKRLNISIQLKTVTTVLGRVFGDRRRRRHESSALARGEGGGLSEELCPGQALPAVGQGHQLLQNQVLKSSLKGREHLGLNIDLVFSLVWITELRFRKVIDKHFQMTPVLPYPSAG